MVLTSSKDSKSRKSTVDLEKTRDKPTLKDMFADVSFVMLRSMKSFNEFARIRVLGSGF